MNIQNTILESARRHHTPIWLVGGPIRDELLDRPYDDWDMVCRKARAVAKDVAKRLRAKFIALDEQNRIYRVILPDAYRPIKTLDFAELQGKLIDEDLKRRDFTINAIALPLQFRVPNSEFRNRLIDPLGGERDLKRKVLRAVSAKAFPEDPLRLLRAFRFQAQFHFKIDPTTKRFIKNYAGHLPKVAYERVREELIRLFKQPGCGLALRSMDESGLLIQIFPEMEACRRTALRYYGPGGVLKHSLESVDNFEWILAHTKDPRIRAYLDGLVGGYPRYAWLKWAAFLHDIGKPATAKVIKGRLRFFEHEHVGAGLAVKAGQRLRLSRQEVQLLSLWVRNHMRIGNLAAAPHITDKALSRFFRDMGEDGVGMVLVSLADHYTYLTKKRWGKGTDPVEKMGYRLLSSYYENRSAILPERVVNGHEVMRALKLKPGPIVGKLLEEIQDAQAEGKIHTKEEALAYARKRVKAAALPTRGPN